MSRTLLRYRRSFLSLCIRQICCSFIRFSISYRPSRQRMQTIGAPNIHVHEYPISHIVLYQISFLNVLRRCLGGLAQSQYHCISYSEVQLFQLVVALSNKPPGLRIIERSTVNFPPHEASVIHQLVLAQFNSVPGLTCFKVKAQIFL